jgi:hypothetical protein
VATTSKSHWIFRLLRPEDVSLWLSTGVVGAMSASGYSWTLAGIASILVNVAGGCLVGMVVCAMARGARLIRDAQDRKFIEKQQAEIREEELRTGRGDPQR